MAATDAEPDGAVLATYFPDDADFRAESEPRTLPASWRAARFDQADREATEHVGTPCSWSAGGSAGSAATVR
ncbi:hypothetical protein [Haloglomus halophilum]|uniref:hypothetical protein n=1 Tax=Haloglomus halophilum TaxID=2962672 RepID=UPI0020C9C403|nr:hypothetical protein [Haloglomus halophilum]